MITNYLQTTMKVDVLGLSPETITIVVVSLIIMLTLSILNMKIIKFFVGLGIGLFTFTCMTQIMPDSVVSWYLSSSLAFLFVIGVYNNILEDNYIVGIFILIFSIFGLIFFVHHLGSSDFNIKVKSGFNILSDKTKEMMDNLDRTDTEK